MRNGRTCACLVPDAAARRPDLPNLDLIIHAERAMNEETLLHPPRGFLRSDVPPRSFP